MDKKKIYIDEPLQIYTESSLFEHSYSLTALTFICGYTILLRSLYAIMIGKNVNSCRKAFRQECLAK